MHKDSKPVPRADPEIIGIFKAFPEEDHEELKRDIAENGVRIPITIAENGTIVDGNRRFQVWVELGHDPNDIPVLVKKYSSRSELINEAIMLNVLRRQLNAAQRAWIAVQHYLPEEKHRAKQRQATSPGRLEPLLPENFQETEGEAYDIAARKVGLSGRTLRNAEKVFQQATRELVKETLHGKTSIYKAYSVVKKLEAFHKKASKLLESTHSKGELSLEKATLIAELPKELHSLAVEKVTKERLSKRETELLVDSLHEQPQRTDEILSRPVVEFTPPPKDIQEYEDKYGSERPKFEQVDCPYCGGELLVNWVLGRINKVGDRDDH